MKIALYKSVEYNYETEFEVTEHQEINEDYIRSSEIVDVEFVRLPDERVVPLQVAALEKAKDAADIAHHAVIKTIDERISKLLAITDQSND